MKIRKFLATFLTVLALSSTMSACGSDTASSSDVSSETASATSVPSSPEEGAGSGKTLVNFGVLQGPTGIGAANLLEKNAGQAALNDYNPIVSAAPDEITAKLISGEVDIATIPTNLAPILFAKTKGEIQMMAINTLGVLHIVTADPSITSIANLKGKTIYVSGQNAVPQYAFEYLLEKNGLTPGTDVTIEYKAAHDEVASLLLAGEAEIALLPEPFVTKVTEQNSSLHATIDLTDVWVEADPDSVLTMGCVVVRREFSEANPEAVKNFLVEYGESIKDANSDPESTAQFCERQGIIPAAVAEKAIPKCNLVFITGDEMIKDADGFFKVLFDANPASVGGTLPDENLYYKG